MRKAKEVGKEVCGAVTQDRVIVGVEMRFPPREAVCVRPPGHNGPHLAKGQDGKHYAFQNRRSCSCIDCRSETLENHCEDVRVVTPSERQQLIAEEHHTIAL